MNKKLIVFVLFLSVIGFYLNRTYSKIYSRSEITDLTEFWEKPILFKNTNFQTTVKYVAIGDSLSVGIGSSELAKTLPYEVATKISKQMSVSLVNLAVKGATVDSVIAYQLERAVAQKPNYITVFIGTNDLHFLKSPSKFESEMNYIIGFLTKNTQAKIIVLNIPYLGSDDLILFPYNVFFDYQVRQYNFAIARVCRTYNLTLIDLYTPTKTIFSKTPNFYSSDNFHPSGDGYLMWGTLINKIEL